MNNDYERQPVPISERKRWYSISLVWIAVGIDLSAMLFGAELGAGMNFQDALLAVVIGSAILGILAAFCAYVGAVTGLSTSMISKFTFGANGGRGGRKGWTLPLKWSLSGRISCIIFYSAGTR